MLGKSTWAVLALTCHIELFTQAHYRRASSPTTALSPLFKDVFLFHWKEESQHAILDELEWTREDAQARPPQSATRRSTTSSPWSARSTASSRRSRRPTSATSATSPSLATPARSMARAGARASCKAYRWQYIVSGAQHPRFVKLLTGMITPAQAERVTRALAPLMA